MQRSKIAGSANGASCNGDDRPSWESAETLYHALYEDTMCLVAVVDREGRLRDLNLKVREALDLSGEIESYTLFDILPEAVARERLAIVGRVLDERRTITVDGMVSGVMRRCTYRPMEGVEAVLAVSFPFVLDAEVEGGDLDHTIVRAHHDDLGPLEKLTERELEVMTLIGEGLPTAEIAHRLHRSEKTVEWHRASLGHKLGVTNRVELARLALRAGLCKLPGLASDTGRAGHVEAVK